MTDWYKELESVPVITGAEFLSNDVVKFTTSTRDFTRNVERSALHTIFLSPDGNTMITPGQEVSQDVKVTAISPSGKIAAILRETREKMRFVEIWEGDIQLSSVEVTDVHEEFYDDDFLGTISFSLSETSLVYLAEAKAPKTTESTTTFARFGYMPSLGEALADRFRPTIYLFSWDLNAPSVKPLSFSADVFRSLRVHFFSQPCFLDDDTLVAVGHELTPEGHLLSVRWCHNRPTAIWKLPLDKISSKSSVSVSSGTILSDPTRAGRSARVYKDAKGCVNVVWLDHQRGGAHASCSCLISASLGGEARTLVPYVYEPGMNEFPGLFVSWALLPRPFLRINDKTYVICTTVAGVRSTVVMADTQQLHQKPREVTPEDGNLWSYAVLATDGWNRILCSRSSLLHPPQLILGHVDPESESVSWRVLWKPPVIAQLIKAMDNFKLMVLPISYPVETIVLLPHTGGLKEQQRLLSIVHGGPHGSSSTAFDASTVAFALAGYIISMPNYTGSVGYGGKNVDALIGKCGSLDVEDVLRSVEAVVNKGFTTFGKGKHFYWGGSHGGFLGAHLVGRYPDVFSAAVLSNPVITALPAESDIPDWYFEEFLPQPPSALSREQIPPELYRTLFGMSPISHAENVKTPVMLFLGLSDHRVSNTHGMALYHALRAQGKTVDLLTFPGQGHRIDGVEEAKAAFDAASTWYTKWQN
ncbi:Alpha/Beta hydrolase protein [Vararia minispora EC-137]|uniref:Alpha/Beta hydrolase protein n=1 Tax=Vararia minispora EC-137 TaxID=1314806 RepID=A0ACB8QAT4_9AGAM|nr:Alpha/Beta hydrolase protein [Vararia minispora EC-137]